jgi:hypothetical protein
MAIGVRVDRLDMADDVATLTLHGPDGLTVAMHAGVRSPAEYLAAAPGASRLVLAGEMHFRHEPSASAAYRAGDAVFGRRCTTRFAGG